MKKYRFLSILLAGCLLFAGCADSGTGNNGGSYNDREDDDDKNSGGNSISDQLAASEKFNTLQDSAMMIRNHANNGIADGNQIEKIGDAVITGIMENGTLTVRFDNADTLDDGYIKSNTPQDTSAGDTALGRAVKVLHASLVETLPDGASFFAKVEEGSFVTGVIYSDDPDNVITKEVNVYIVEGRSNAYEDAKHNPIGVYGKYIPE